MSERGHTRGGRGGGRGIYIFPSIPSLSLPLPNKQETDQSNKANTEAEVAAAEEEVMKVEEEVDIKVRERGKDRRKRIFWIWGNIWIRRLQ